MAPEPAYTRESSDRPKLKAFCRVAPTVRFSVFAIFSALVFFFARLFKVRTFSDVHARLVVFFIKLLLKEKRCELQVHVNDVKLAMIVGAEKRGMMPVSVGSLRNGKQEIIKLHQGTLRSSRCQWLSQMEMTGGRQPNLAKIVEAHR